MGMLSKALGYVCRSSFSSSLYVNRRGCSNRSLILQRRDDDCNIYFTLLSTEEEEEEQGKKFSPKQELKPPCRLRWFVKNSISCNGLLFLNYDRGDKAVVWNPSTQNYRLLPSKSPFIDPHIKSETESVIVKSTCFGFDPISNDYKMFRYSLQHFSLDDDEDDVYDEKRVLKNNVEVYSFKNDLWKELPLPEIDTFPTNFESSVLINGYYYWLCENPFFGPPTHVHILCYDIAKEEFTTLPLPDVGRKLLGGYRFELLEHDGLLCGVFYPRLGIDKCFQVWLMRNGSWDEEPCLNLSGVERPLGFWSKGRYIFFQGLNHELMVLDQSTMEMNNLGIYSNPYFKRDYFSFNGEPDRTMKLFSHLNNPIPLSHQDC